MEYVDGWNLDSSFTRGLTPHRQIKMVRAAQHSLKSELMTRDNIFQIQSCRRAARVLDVADVSQRDWHNDQVILYTNHTTKLDHAVVIDFASNMRATRVTLYPKFLWPLSHPVG
jgi:hypothetical protein